MKRLFLTSQVHYVASDIASKLGDQTRLPMVFIDTCIKDKVRSAEALNWHYQNKQKLLDAGFSFDIYDITGKTADELRQDLAQYQIMYIEGGNTFYLLKSALENDFSQLINERVNEGMIYIGTSAGSIIAGPDTRSGSRPGKNPEQYNLTTTKGFNLVNFTVMPHWGDKSKTADYLNYKLPLAYEMNNPFILLNDNQYVEVVDNSFQIVDVSR